MLDDDRAAAGGRRRTVRRPRLRRRAARRGAQLTIALTPHAAATQVALTFAASLAQWGFVGLWLPYNHLAHNICELVVLGMQTLTLALPVLGHAGGLSWREVGTYGSSHLVTTKSYCHMALVARCRRRDQEMTRLVRSTSLNR